jgi:hypothetical protein
MSAGRALKRASAAIVVLATFAVTSERIRDPDRSEASAIGALRAITSGESFYSSVNGGYDDTVDCLRSAACIPGIHGSAFLSPNLTQRGEFRGYRLTFYPGPPAPHDDVARWSPSSITRFAIVATPIPSATQSRRSFCSDDRQLIYVTIDAVPRVENGRCLDVDNPLR